MFLICCPALLFAQSVKDGWKQFYNNEWKKARETFKSASSGAGNHEAYLGLSFLDYYEEKTEDAFKNFVKYYDAASSPEKYHYLLSLAYSGILPFTGGKLSEDEKKFILNLDKDAQLPGTIKAMVNQALAKDLNAAGDFKKDKAFYDKIGAYTNWSIVGEFQNISGSGFNKEFGPLDNASASAEFKNVNGATVKWFTPPMFRIDRWIDLEYNFYTGNRTIYAQTFVKSNGDQEVQLRFGVSGSIKVYVNDHEVISEEEDANNDYDNYNVKLKLSSGWNRILVKVGEHEANSCNFLMRITDDKGNPIALESTAEAQTYTKKKVDFTTIRPEHLVYLEQVYEKNPDNLLLGYILSEAYLAADKKYLTRKTLNQIEKKAPNSAFVKSQLLEVYNREDNETGVNKLIEWFKVNEPSNSLSLNILYSEAVEQKKYETADSLLDVIERKFGTNSDVYSKKVSLLLDRKKQKEAIELIEQGYEDYPNSYFFVYLKYLILNSQKDVSGAKKVIKKYLKKNYSQEAYKTLANILFEEGDVAGGMKIYEMFLENVPYSSAYMETLGDIYYELKDYDKALEYYNQILKYLPYVSSTYESIAQVYMDMGKEKIAKENYETALRINPNSFTAREKIRSFNGQKENIFDELGIKEIDALAIFKSAPDKSAYPKDNSAILLWDISKVIYNDWVSEEKHTMIVKVYDAAGIDQWKEYYVGGYGNQRSKIIKAEVLKANGTKFEAEKRGGNIVFTNLEPGDGIHVTYSYQNSKYDKFAEYFDDQHYFETFFPIKENRYSLYIHPSLKFQYQFSNKGFEPKKGKVKEYDHYVWEKMNVQSLKSEDYMPDLVDFAEVLHLSGYPDWNYISQWYSDLTKTKSRGDFEVKETVKELFEGKESLGTMEKVRVIHEYIVKNIRYSSIPFRQSGIVPQKASKVINTKIGDCKDVSTLFVAMCKEAGINDVQLVLINTRDNGRKDQLLPNINFNHCIAKLTHEGKPYYIELTSDKLSLQTYGYNLKNAFGLEIYENLEGKAVKPIYVNSPTRVSDDIIRNSNVKINGREVSVSIKTVKRGAPAAGSRYNYADISEEERRKELLAVLSKEFPSVKVSKFEFNETLKSLTDSVDYISEYTLQNHVTSIAGLNVFTLPWSDANKSIGAMSNDDRKFPLDIWKMSNLDKEVETMTIELPAGKVLAEAPKNIKYSCDAATYELTFKVTGNKITVTRTYIQKKDVISIEEFDEFKKFYEKVVEADTKQFAFK